MTPEQHAELMDALARMTTLLELIAFPEKQPCQHEEKIDLSVMGQAPFTRYRCKQCGETIDMEG
jgi:transposase-like protein